MNYHGYQDATLVAGRRTNILVEPDSTRASPQRAFLAGVRGEAYDSSGDADGLAESAGLWISGPNERMVLAMQRFPGLLAPRSAFETGRVLRAIARLFDQAGAPTRVFEQFRDNLVAAVIGQAMRRGTPPWGADETVEMFMELYGRVLGSQDGALLQVKDALLGWAREELRPLPGAAPRPQRPPPPMPDTAKRAWA